MLFTLQLHLPPHTPASPDPRNRQRLSQLNHICAQLLPSSPQSLLVALTHSNQLRELTLRPQPHRLHIPFPQSPAHFPLLLPEPVPAFSPRDWSSPRGTRRFQKTGSLTALRCPGLGDPEGNDGTEKVLPPPGPKGQPAPPHKGVGSQKDRTPVTPVRSQGRGREGRRQSCRVRGAQGVNTEPVP